MVAIRNDMNVTILRLEITPIDPSTDQYRLDVRFKCNDCGHEYLIGEEDADKCDEFLKSLEDGGPTKYIGCPKGMLHGGVRVE